MTKEDLIIQLLIANLKGIQVILQYQEDDEVIEAYRRYAEGTMKLAKEFEDTI